MRSFGYYRYAELLLSRSLGHDGEWLAARIALLKHTLQASHKALTLIWQT
jgi:hypothetical protein